MPSIFCFRITLRGGISRRPYCDASHRGAIVLVSVHPSGTAKAHSRGGCNLREIYLSSKTLWSDLRSSLSSQLAICCFRSMNNQHWTNVSSLPHILKTLIPPPLSHLYPLHRTYTQPRPHLCRLPFHLFLFFPISFFSARHTCSARARTQVRLVPPGQCPRGLQRRRR